MFNLLTRLPANPLIIYVVCYWPHQCCMHNDLCCYYMTEMGGPEPSLVGKKFLPPNWLMGSAVRRAGCLCKAI